MTAIEHLLRCTAGRAGHRLGAAAFRLAGDAGRRAHRPRARRAPRSAADVRYVVAAIGLALMLTLPVVTAVQLWRVGVHAATSAATADRRAGRRRQRSSPAAAPARDRGEHRTASEAARVRSPMLDSVRVEPWLPDARARLAVPASSCSRCGCSAAGCGCSG